MIVKTTLNLKFRKVSTDTSLYMCRVILCLLFLFSFSKLCLAQDEKEMLQQLDNLIEDQSTIIRAKEQRIQLIKDRFRVKNLTDKQIYDINETLYQEYMAFKCDSAYYYATKNMELAKRRKWWKAYNHSTLERVHLLSLMALFDLAESSLSTIHKESIETREDSLAYYVCYSDLHVFGAEFTEGTPFHDINVREAQEERRLALSVSSPNEVTGATNIANYLFNNHQVKRSIDMMTRFLAKSKLKMGSRDYSIVTSDLAFFYSGLNDRQNRKKYLILSAMSDLKGAVMENNSLRELATMLMEEGDLNRAYKYINVSINDAQFYGTRLRNMQIVRIMPKIVEAYQIYQHHNQRRLSIITVIISIISILFLIALILLTRFILSYHKSTQMVEKMNKRLHDTVIQLTEANKIVNEKSKIKEQYIGRFLQLASELIDRHEERRRFANRLARENKLSDLFAMIKSNSGLAQDVKLFYKNFDEAFLNIFPHFPQTINSLLNPENQIKIKDGLLNTELRILALLRLGITDNNAIAAILRSSITTVYTYRSKMKAKALDKDSFENRVMML